MKTNKPLAIRPGRVYILRNGAYVHISHVADGQVYSTWHPGASWNLDGTHTHSAFDIVARA